MDLISRTSTTMAMLGSNVTSRYARGPSWKTGATKGEDQSNSVMNWTSSVSFGSS